MRKVDLSVKRVVLLLFISVIIFSLVGCSGSKYSEFQWPESDIAGLISPPKSNIGNVLWDTDSGFRVDVAKTSKSDYDSYIDDCWDKGFTVDYYRGDTSFWAHNEDGYNIVVMYDKKVMSITMSSPNDSSEELPTNDPSSGLTDEPSVQSPEQSEEPLDISTIPEGTKPPVEETPTEKPNALYYSTNTLEQAKQGNSGVFAYKRNPGNYYIYWIIDLDERYAYYFTYGNENGICDRIQIDEDGDLNSYITVTYHDGDSSWQEGLCFKRVRQPDRLINSMADGTQYEFLATDLDDALKIRDSMEIVDY